LTQNRGLRLFCSFRHTLLTPKAILAGSVAVQFGGCDGKIANGLPIMKRWNYVVRPYRPRPEIMNSRWKFPQAQPVNRDCG